jgi:hypothetical protein
MDRSLYPRDRDRPVYTRAGWLYVGLRFALIAVRLGILAARDGANTFGGLHQALWIMWFDLAAVWGRGAWCSWRGTRRSAGRWPSVAPHDGRSGTDAPESPGRLVQQAIPAEQPEPSKPCQTGRQQDAVAGCAGHLFPSSAIAIFTVE